MIFKLYLLKRDGGGLQVLWVHLQSFTFPRIIEKILLIYKKHATSCACFNYWNFRYFFELKPRIWGLPPGCFEYTPSRSESQSAFLWPRRDFNSSLNSRVKKMLTMLVTTPPQKAGPNPATSKPIPNQVPICPAK